MKETRPQYALLAWIIMKDFFHPPPSLCREVNVTDNIPGKADKQAKHNNKYQSFDCQGPTQQYNNIRIVFI